MGILPIPRTHKNIFLKSKKNLPTLPVGEGLGFPIFPLA